MKCLKKARFMVTRCSFRSENQDDFIFMRIFAMFKIVIRWTDSQNKPSKRSRVPERLVAGSLV